MTSDSFLPRIQSVFYSVFDVQQGPKIVAQVPEGLIAVPESLATPTSPVDYHREPARSISSSSGPFIFHFDDVSKYVIPPSFPVELKGKYDRNYFRYNLCFVFDRSADLSCYEPIVRKVSRVLSSCEKESGFLHNPETSAAIPAILEQLYEDLNSYSETSIAIDRFNSIELKIFPFYPNPPQVQDWMVPLALINISKRVEDNWDLTMVKVAKFIDGTNHVSRIAYLANCDITLTRQAISHLLFYQVIMTVDIFQFSNMYTLSSSIQWLADEAHVRDECGPYVTKVGHSMPDWPKLLRLYSRMKPGKTVLEWMNEHNVHQLGIDVRRFTSFGVIKGFLRRVHRYPVLLPPDPSQVASVAVFPRPRGNSISGGPPVRYSPYTPSPPHTDPTSPAYLTTQPTAFFRVRSPSAIPGQNGSPEVDHSAAKGQKPSAGHPSPAIAVVPISATNRARRASAAEKVLEQLRNRSDLQKPLTSIVGSPRTAWGHYHECVTTPTFPTAAIPQDGHGSRRPGSRRQSLITPIGPPPSPVVPKVGLPTSNLTGLRSRLSWNQNTSQLGVSGMRPYPSDFLTLLDGEHHTDELAVRFEAGWPLLEQWLVHAGGGAGDGDFGKVCIIYR
ncbi:Nitrogen permease regulator 2 like protein [Termitomyces sp. T112]|nr:Nitrogen permease regulator 2 like protein [Termitomyces sp. T112]